MKTTGETGNGTAETFHARIKRLRLNRRSGSLSVVEVAARLGLDRSTVAKWEIEGPFSRTPSVKHLRDLADVLQCTLDELLP